VFLLDTNIISELRRKKPHGAVVAWFDSVGFENISISAITIGEIQTGIERTRARDPAKAREIEFWADHLVNNYEILPIDSKIVRLWAKLMLSKSDIFYEDAFVAATAITHNLTVATRNVRDFAMFPAEVSNPFDYKPK
jgi:predicted nucleic acid-binding protein